MIVEKNKYFASPHEAPLLVFLFVLALNMEVYEKRQTFVLTQSVRDSNPGGGRRRNLSFFLCEFFAPSLFAIKIVAINRAFHCQSLFFM